MSPPLFELTRGTTPLVISMPHSGTYLPPTLAARLSAAGREVPDTDWFIPELYACANGPGATVIRATHSRYVVDLNRPPDGAPLYPGRRETGVCPVESFDGDILYAPGDEPTQAEIAARLTTYWHPYHDQLQRLIAERVQAHGHCLLWDAHSIHSTVPGLFDGRLPDLNVGTADGVSCSAARVAGIVALLDRQQRFTHVCNGRFKGGYITRHYGRPAAGVEALQLEIAQAAYLDERRLPAFNAGLAADLAALLGRLLSQFCAEA